VEESLRRLLTCGLLCKKHAVQRMRPTFFGLDRHFRTFEPPSILDASSFVNEALVHATRNGSSLSLTGPERRLSFCAAQ
jgi:hypothetical protein